MNPFLQALLEQLKNVNIDLPSMIADPEFSPAALTILRLAMKYAKPKA